jgi:hypothetical protein
MAIVHDFKTVFGLDRLGSDVVPWKVSWMHPPITTPKISKSTHFLSDPMSKKHFAFFTSFSPIFQ